jgi:hypothetical protein
MSTVSVNSPNPKPEIEQAVAHPEPKPRVWIAWSSFFFALLQSVCTFFAAVDGLRVIIGFGALAISASVGTVLDSFHGSWLHLPMIVLAFAGALLNLVVLWQVRRLRNRPSAAWRVTPPSRNKIRMERLQFALSILTLILIGFEESLHFHWHGRL